MTENRKRLYNKINGLIEKHLKDVYGITKEKLVEHQNIYARYIADLQWAIHCYDLLEKEAGRDNNHLTKRINFEFKKAMNKSLRKVNKYGSGFKYKDEYIEILEEILRDLEEEQ